MSDLESRLTEALRAESESAPEGAGLADAARTRARTRRRTTTAAVGAFAVAALAVPIAIVAGGGPDDDGDSRRVADDPSAAELDPVWFGRWESWRGVSVFVPEDWEYGAQAAWCADGGSVETFRVTRPGGVVPSIACTPGSSYGLSFQELEDREPFDWPVVQQTGGAWPPHTYVGAHGENGVLVMVAGPDREELLDVLATVQAIDNVDPNGCGVTVDVEPTAPAGEMAVCRYDAAGELEQSEPLRFDDAVSAAGALDAARAGDLDCQPSDSPPVTIRMRDETHDVRIELDGACTVIEGLAEARIADADVLYWALSPGWIGDATGLPMPDELRQRR